MSKKPGLLKSGTPAASSKPSPSPSQPSLHSGTVTLGPAGIHSQPADTGTGNTLLTQVNYAISYLKSKPQGTALTFDEILSYLSLQFEPQDRKAVLFQCFKANPSMRYEPQGPNGQGVFLFKPKHDISSSSQLLSRLQSQHTFQGFPGKGLEEGWADYKEALEKLEREHKVLILAAKKDGVPRMIWPDDATLHHPVEEEFRDMWGKIRLPDPESTATELERNGLMPTNKFKKAKVAPTAPVKKPKKIKRSGKITNYHMQDILKDYSHKRK
jgi:transcription initiation factor TFIIE subunit beta